MDDGNRPPSRIPVSTYRLQLNNFFRIADASRVVGYLSELGITDIYSSPYFRSGPGSTHGYDVVDHNSLNPELGTEDEYEDFFAEIRNRGMGQILDIVPNHMCISCNGNAWWMDVLENGQAARCAEYFDIDWDPVKTELKGKVLLPMLADQYGKVLEAGELVLKFEEGAFVLCYGELKLPLLPETYVDVLKHRISSLELLLKAEDPYLTEYLSIITSLSHLPGCAEQDAEKISERYREKEIAKKRLFTLCSNNGDIAKFVDENVTIINGVKGDTKSFDLLDELLSRQVYRLAYWRVAADEINYRRFFDINSFGAIRVENPDVFWGIHGLVLRLIKEGKVTGLRVDHPDGLYNPTEYFAQLQRECLYLLTGGTQPGQAEVLQAGADHHEQQEKATLSFYVIGEKILMKGEKVPDEWPVSGTTGYAFMNKLNGIFVDADAAKKFTRIYTDFTGSRSTFQEIVYEKKKLIMEAVMSGEINTLAHVLSRIADKDRHTRDFTLNSLRKAIIEVIAFFPVYRSYISTYSVTERDRQYIELAVLKARRKNLSLSGSVFDFLRDILLLRFPEGISDGERKTRHDFVMRFQQITSPVTAKGVEDTAYYVYNRLVSLNEVGGAPERFGSPVDAFHGHNIGRLKSFPHTLNATSTHDTKRGEDVRARINVLSEMPAEWKKHLALWSRLNRRKKALVDGNPVPDANEEYLFYQTLLGTWPTSPMDAEKYVSYKKRIVSYMQKSIREAKANSSWIDPDIAYEEAMTAFIDSVLENGHDNHFLKSFSPFHNVVMHLGIFNSLSQTLMKIASPGVPDFYQGTELWDLTLVDPDNRGAVDYESRIRILADIKKREEQIGPMELAREFAAGREDGRIKFYVTYKALAYRKANREIFETGDYLPLEASGERADNICAFARRLGERTAVIVIPRLLGRHISEPAEPFSWRDIWGTSAVLIPFATAGDSYRNVFTGETMKVDSAAISLSKIFADLPVTLLERI